MNRILPAPLMSAVLLVAWLLMNGSASAGQVALGAILAIGIPLITAPLRGDQPRIRRPGAVVRLGLVVLRDIVVSNLQVARLILGPESRLRPRFVWVPVDIRDPHGIAALAGIITMTPGTLSAELSEDRRHLLVHALDAEDERALIESIKARYETPLIEIFDSAY